MACRPGCGRRPGRRRRRTRSLHLLEVGDGVGLRDRNLLEAAVERPRQSAFGEDAYPTIESKAAALLESLARNHPFIDGNKRIGVLASFVSLEINGFEVETTNDEVVETVLALITRKIDFNGLIGRIGFMAADSTRRLTIIPRVRPISRNQTAAIRTTATTTLGCATPAYRPGVCGYASCDEAAEAQPASSGCG